MANDKELIPAEAYVEVYLRKGSKSDLAKRVKEGDGFPTYTVEEILERFTSIEDAKKRLNLKYSQYPRRLLKESALEGVKVKVGKGERLLVTLESIEWRKAKVSDKRSSRTTRNYLLRIPPEQEAKLRTFLKSLKVEWSLELAYVPKDKEDEGDEPSWARVIEKL